MKKSSVRITGARTVDLRFPTSRLADGSDAMNPDPDYSAAYVVLETDQAGLAGCGMTFTIGRGNDLCVAAIDLLLPRVVGKNWMQSQATWPVSGGRSRETVTCAGWARKRASYT